MEIIFLRIFYGALFPARDSKIYHHRKPFFSYKIISSKKISKNA